MEFISPNAKLSHPDQASELLRKVVFYTDRKSEQNRRVAARGWLQRLVGLICEDEQSRIRAHLDLAKSRLALVKAKPLFF